MKLLVQVHGGRRLRQKLDDSDIVQQTLLEAHEDFATFRGTTEQQFLAWLRKILANTLINVLDYYGAQKRDLRLERRLETELRRSSQSLSMALVDPLSTPDEKARQREQSILVADALERLPTHYREVIILVHIEGKDFLEVSLRMGRSIDSVKNIWARALAKLKHQLGQSDGSQ